MKRQIVLEVTFKAIALSDEYIPESTMAEETVTLVMPNLDNKFVVFPKVLEGVTIGVIRNHQENVRSFLSKKAEEERRRREYEQMGLLYPAGQDSEQPFDSDDDGDDETATDEPGVDFARIAQDAEKQLQAEGFDVEVTHIPATTKEA